MEKWSNSWRSSFVFVLQLLRTPYSVLMLLQEIKICPLVAMLQAEIYWALRAKDTGLISVDTVINVSYPGLTEHSTMHLWCQCLWILIPASVAK